MPFRCLDESCWKSEKIVHNVSRKEVLQHVQTKSQEKLIDVLQQYKIVNVDYRILSRWTITNLFADFCFVVNQDRLVLLQ